MKDLSYNQATRWLVSPKKLAAIVGRTENELAVFAAAGMPAAMLQGARVNQSSKRRPDERAYLFVESLQWMERNGLVSIVEVLRASGVLPPIVKILLSSLSS